MADARGERKNRLHLALAIKQRGVAVACDDVVGLAGRRVVMLRPLDERDMRFRKRLPEQRDNSRRFIDRCADVDAHHEGDSSRSTRSAPSGTRSPTLKFTAVTTPAIGAAIVCSIFIASSTINARPFSTFSPGLTSTDTIVPDIGAIKWPPDASSSPACASGS